MINNIKSLLGVCVVGVLSLGSGAGLAATCPDPSAYPMNGCSLDGTVAGSFPYFDQSVYVSLKNKKNGDSYLSASYGGVASGVSELNFDPETSYSIDNTFFQFKAKEKNGEVTGSIRIMGKIDGLGITSQQKLMTADLTGVWDSAGDLIGFNTMNIQCNDAINAVAQCTSAEVIYLSQLVGDTIDLNGSKGKFSATGHAVTSVPVPAAAWLFGSGLVGLVGLARRRKG